LQNGCAKTIYMYSLCSILGPVLILPRWMLSSSISLNLDYTKTIWNICTEFGLPLVYASSAATYGLGEQGYDDDESKIPMLKPLNPYGDSKNDFDIWALKQEKKPYFWAGLKFFNVYGPNEYHKGRMASVIFHTFNQIKKTGAMKLFESHNPEFKDGEQMRDFVYIKDVVNVLYFLMHHRKDSGIITWVQVKQELSLTLQHKPSMQWIPRFPFHLFPHLRTSVKSISILQRQIWKKLRSIGYSLDFYSLEEGVEDYVKNYLVPNRYL
jgi:ADP-L-glycero-D-manno-heptose 6-epimerase